MLSAMIAILSIVLLTLGLVSGIAVVLLIRWLLTSPGDDSLPFDPHQRLPPSRGPWVWNYLVTRFGGQRRLTYRRDRNGRFRKRE